MIRPKAWVRGALIVFLGMVVATATGGDTSATQIEALLASKTPPPGVIFEISENDESFLQNAIPRIADYSERLKERFPSLRIAVVSHGMEMFALDARKANKPLRRRLSRLVESQKVKFHVCGTFAGWYHRGKNDFPPYVDVVPAGPDKIEDYEALGYRLIYLDK